MNILITGCNGQLGNEMQLLEKNYHEYKFFNTDVAELDITDQAAIDRFVSVPPSLLLTRQRRARNYAPLSIQWLRHTSPLL